MFATVVCLSVCLSICLSVCLSRKHIRSARQLFDENVFVGMTVATSCFAWQPRWGTDGNQKAYFFSLSLKVNLVWRALKNNTIRTPSNVGSYSVTNSNGATQRFSAEFEFRKKRNFLLLTGYEVHTVSYGPSFFSFDLWPKREARGP